PTSTSSSWPTPRTTVVAASRDQEAARAVQDVFMSERFRVYTSSDVIGVELGGALKNIIALGAGVSDGIGFGDNAKAALMTRGITEMTRLGVAMGAKPSTFAGLSGVGDLIVTCTSMHSRNRRCGILMGQGKSPEEAQKEVGMVVEGITTCEAAFKLRRTKHVEMPITECIYRCIKGEIGPEEAVSLLMTREKKDEVQPDLDFGEVHG
ncbi:NAD(P)H-dependent glycerol-3-phosphate dehydrogenase, partial [Eubacterium pyruvativorans]|uniref:NAD(P)H-dependent glycerol-3-phosphate dehydrogenase n=1 Tax=Eubacterium pyruvativorans TaxID=155865 RepID=UPI001569869D